MLYIKNNQINPYYNLALEEYVLKELDIEDDLVFLWQNQPSVIIGRNQNTLEEINTNIIKKHNIKVVRRMSGGGAVYHDLGNLNFTFISNDKTGKTFQSFTEPIISTLNKLGVRATFSGRNDITIENKKISGNAQCLHKNKILHHGTILFNSNLDRIEEALNVNNDKIESKGIKSIRSRVTNIYPYLNPLITLDIFKEKLLQEIFNNEDYINNEYVLTKQDYQKINQLVEKKYKTWEWNYGESPMFDIQKSKRFPLGKLDIRLNVNNGLIENCRIFGDFFEKKDIKELEDLLIGIRFEENTLKNYFKKVQIEQFFINISSDEVLNCLFS